MKNPFSRKKSNLPVIQINQPPNISSGTISVLPSSLGTMNINNNGMVGIGSTVLNNPMMVSGSVSWGGSTSISSGHTGYWAFSQEELLEQRKKQLTDEFEKNPELFSEIIVELRKRKIKKIKESL